MNKITMEWGKDIHDNSVLLVRKAKGKISIPEIQAAMIARGWDFCGAWAILVAVREDGHQGWDGGRDPKGDVLELYQIGDQEPCPICAMPIVEYCPHCGGRIHTNAAASG